jgi:F-type H+-transporting ATPase subunit gamma
LLSAHVNVPGGVSLELAREVAGEAARLFTDGSAGSVYVVYSEFKSAMTQIVRTRRILPIERGHASSGDNAAAVSNDEITDYLFEPGAAELLAGLLPRYLETTVYQAMLEGAASEHGARMTAMDSATRNAGDMMDALTLQMNKARQAKITGELMEIIGGAEALNG